MDNKQSVAVLLATYNGEKYLAEQLDSIIKQKNINVHIIARDDGSTDKTVTMLHEYSKKYAHKITVISKKSNENGHLANFSALCEYALTTSFEYFCFADQDDVWHDNKLNLLLSRLIKAQGGSSVPLLVHSDMRVVDEALSLIDPSFINYQGLPEPDNHDFPLFCHQNVVTGCATMFNRDLLEVAAPLPKGLLVHDYWFALNAKVFGKLIYENSSLIDYRQHGVNSIGATKVTVQRSYVRSYIYKMALRYLKIFPSYVHQCKLITQQPSYRQHANDYLDAFAKLDQQSLFTRIRLIPIYFPNANSLMMKVYFVFLMTILPVLVNRK